MSFSVAGPDNCVVVAGASYVYATVDGKGFVLRAQCPHRGGPLHLADVTADGAFLVCPWHSNRIRVRVLRAQIPAVRTGTRVTAVLPDTAPLGWPIVEAEPDGAVSFEHRPLSPKLVCPHGGAGHGAR